MSLDSVRKTVQCLPSPPSSASPAESIACDPLEPALTPCESNEEQLTSIGSASQHLLNGLHVLNTEADALRNLAHIYATEATAQCGLELSVSALADCHRRGGKVVVTGVGKSGLIGKKLVATLQSLAIPTVNLHPTEALHGDMGMITPNDLLIVITYSGKTPELLLLLPHLDERLPVIILTSHLRREDCLFISHRPNAILLPTPVVEPEKISFGVAAPTTSTTVALAVGDALAIAAAREIHGDVERIFAKNHPGGAIGAALK